MTVHAPPGAVAPVAVAPDVWAVRVPMRGVLDHVYAYLLETGDGVVLVDTGPNTAEAAAVVTAALAAIGSCVENVAAIVATHAHPDHYGLADRLSRLSRARIALHPADAGLATAGTSPPAETAAREREWLRRLGAPTEEHDILVGASARWHATAPVRVADDELRVGRPLAFGDWEIAVTHTPGHSPGHVCLHDVDRGVAFVGDHVLPTITPNVALWAGATGNPLGDYLASLRLVRDLPVATALPGHEEPITALAERVDELLAHHEAHLRAAEAIVGDAPATVWEVAARMPWGRAWPAITRLMRQAALGEAYAHLVELEARARVQRIDDEPLRYAA